MPTTVITYRTTRGGSVTGATATLCSACAPTRTDLADVQHGRHTGTCESCHYDDVSPRAHDVAVNTSVPASPFRR